MAVQLINIEKNYYDFIDDPTYITKRAWLIKFRDGGGGTGTEKIRDDESNVKINHVERL